MRIAVLMGGSSEEREVSLASGCEVSRALRTRGHEVVAIDSAVGIMSPAQEVDILEAGIGTEAPGDVSDAWSGHHASTGSNPSSAGSVTTVATLPDAAVIATEPALRDVDVVFVALHGGAGEDGTIQTLLEIAGVPYIGSGPVPSALAMDKDLSKRLLRDHGITTPAWLTGSHSGDAVASHLGLPVIVKPVSGGSSVRLTLARSAEEIDTATRDAEGGGDTVMYEAYVQGREFTVGILDDEPLPVVEIIPEHELFDYECKYQPGMAREEVPADIPSDLAAELQQEAVRVHAALRLEDYSRVDFMVDGQGGIWCLEANALPGLTSNSLLPKAAAAAGIGFAELCERISELGRARGARRRGPQ